MSRLERLLNLTAALLTASRPLTADELRSRVPGYPDATASPTTFRRAFERDKDALRDMGIPVETAPVPGTEHHGVEGYLIRREAYELRDPGLEPDELAALHLAATAVRVEGLPGTEALWKLGGAAAAEDVEPSPAVAIAALPPLAPLFGAVTARQQARFRYRGEDRLVDPWRLSFQRGHWYLTGHDHGRGEQRQFRLDRMEGPVTVGPPGGFERPAGLEPGRLQPWELGGEPPVEARLLVDADQAGWSVDHLGAEAVVGERSDGAVELAVTVTNRDAFRSFVLGFLDHAEVLHPPELRAEVVSWLEALCPA